MRVDVEHCRPKASRMLRAGVAVLGLAAGLGTLGQSSAYAKGGQGGWPGLCEPGGGFEAINTHVGQCAFCHSSTLTTAQMSAANYVKGALEVDVLEDYIRSSYWSPGQPKALAMVWRPYYREMPPGATGPYEFDTDPGAKPQALEDWYNDTLPSCGTIFSVTENSSAVLDCLFGAGLYSCVESTGGEEDLCLMHTCN